MKSTKNLIVLAMAVLPLVAASQVADVATAKRATVTIQNMLEIDALQAEEKFRSEAVKAGVIQAKAEVVAPTYKKPDPVWSVRSIYGLGEHLSADIKRDDQLFKGLSAGMSVDKCMVVKVADACVTMEPVMRELVTKGGKKRVVPAPKGSCPAQVCWTGAEMNAEFNVPQKAIESVQAVPMPSPLPIPVPVGSAGGSPATPSIKK